MNGAEVDRRGSETEENNDSLAGGGERELLLS